MDVPFIRIGGRLISTESEEGKEYLRWERKPDYNPNAPENQYPRMLYRANKRPDGVVSVNDVSDSMFGGQAGTAEAFNRGCQRIVANEREEQAALESGWRRTQQDALESYERKERGLGDAAAHRAYEDRNMSEAAKAEVKAAEVETPAHVAEVPEARRWKRKPQRKVAAA